MKSVAKTVGVLGALYLLYWDASLLFSLGGLSSIEAFDSVMTWFVPCSMLFGITMLLYLFQTKGYKVMGWITGVFAGLSALLRLGLLGYQIGQIIGGTGATGTQESIALLEFFGYTVLLLAQVFVCMYLVFQKLRKTTLSVVSLSLATLLGDWVWMLMTQYGLYQTDTGNGLLAFLGECLSVDFILAVVLLLSYAVLMLFCTNLLQDEKRS